MVDLPRCPECGYTKEDALIHWDHYLCKGKIPSEISLWKPTVEQLQHLIDKYQAVRFHRSAEDSLELCIFKWALSQVEGEKA